MHRLLLLGLNHTTAPLELRERLAFDAQQRAAALRDLREKYPQCEAVLLSTCNRVELYLARQPHDSPKLSEITEFLTAQRNVPADVIQPHLYHQTDRQVVEHLFRVACSLDSMVLGETQILGQVREAYDAARQAGTVGSLLNPLFQRAAAVAKEVMSDTALSDGRLSVASIAVDYARQIFDVFSDKIVLNIGAGKMASLVLSHLAQLAPGKLLICNRDGSRAAELAEKFRGQSVGFESLEQHLADADIIVTSTGSQTPIISREMFRGVMRRRRYRPVFLIDIAVPRDVAADVGELENVYLYNLDDLQQAASTNRAARGGAVDAADAIVQEHVRQFVNWHRARQLGPMIDQLYRRSHALAQEELSRTIARLPNVSDAEKQHLEDLARRIVNKLLHDPIQMLRESDNLHAPSVQYLHAMEKLFRLEEPPAALPDFNEVEQPEKNQPDV